MAVAPELPEPTVARLPATPSPVRLPEVQKKTLIKANVKKIINNYYSHLVKCYESYRKSAEHSHQIGPVPRMQVTVLRLNKDK